ncbi:MULTISPECIES: AI-2E family transporter [Niastella]|uniref:AI-2E family transporter n=1 Tax=Niastella soli TaxID=2821487 RepID=A0ABS3YUG3_9BACT|nr:AI-2E family transporter [Niastella soli]MBO9201574.1 AI-2E family transporter [Niastella soli]
MENMHNNHYSLLKPLQITLFGALLLYFGSTLFIPICYGLLIAVILFPFCKWLERHRWPRSLAITAGLLLVFIIFSIIISLLFIEIDVLRKEVPELMVKAKPSLVQLQLWIESALGLSVASQNEWWQQLLHNLSGNSSNILQSIIAATAGGLFTLFLVPMYAALFLHNRETFVQFLVKLIGGGHRQQLQVILAETINTYFHFIKGMVLVYLIVGALNSIGLLALGIPHAILFGMLTAIMTIIPYVGIVISALLPISIAWITKDSIWYPIGVVAIFTFVQYLEANIIFPKVVATQLKVSTWATLVAIVAGGLLWGVSGMILFIPFIGILKIITEHIPEWGALNVLLGRDLNVIEEINVKENPSFKKKNIQQVIK